MLNQGQSLALHEEPIIAQSTPVGKGALALIRVSGVGVIELVAQCTALMNKQNLQNVPSHTVHAGWIMNSDGNRIDQVVVYPLKGPKTFTGQDMVEISCHNNQLIINHIINQIIHLGARIATSGEFTKRAVINKKLDLIQAEAINEILEASNETALKYSLAQLEGTLSAFITQCEKKLLHIISLCEVSFEFVEEGFSLDDQIRAEITTLLTELATLINAGTQQRYIKEGIRIALLGSVNTGKSSLFNQLLGKNRAIVSSIPGTTRDVIESSWYIDGFNATVIDTAGIRSTGDIIEQLGIEKSFQEAAIADIILLVYDASRPLTAQEKTIYEQLITSYANKIITVYTKKDLIDLTTASLLPLCVNTHDEQDLVSIKTLLHSAISKLMSGSSSPFLLNNRQLALLTNLYHELNDLNSTMTTIIEHEIVSYQLRLILGNIADLLGHTISEQSLDMIFKDFCIGK